MILATAVRLETLATAIVVVILVTATVLILVTATVVILVTATVVILVLATVVGMFATAPFPSPNLFQLNCVRSVVVSVAAKQPQRPLRARANIYLWKQF